MPTFTDIRPSCYLGNNYWLEARTKRGWKKKARVFLLKKGFSTECIESCLKEFSMTTKLEDGNYSSKY